MIKRHILMVLVLMFLCVEAFARRSCEKPVASEPVLTNNDLKIYNDIESMRSDFLVSYESGRRLKNRAYWKEETGSFSFHNEDVLPQALITALSSHITQALELSYAEGVFYADMGHVHVLVPEGAQGSSDSLLARQEVLLLYHTAELIKLKEEFSAASPLVENEWLQWRYYHRNFVGTLNEKETITLMVSNDPFYNTVRFVDGYKELRTLYFNANKDGCFSYRDGDDQKYFDISSKR